MTRIHQGNQILCQKINQSEFSLKEPKGQQFRTCLTVLMGHNQSHHTVTRMTKISYRMVSKVNIMKQGNQMLCAIDNALESIITSLMLGGDL